MWTAVYIVYSTSLLMPRSIANEESAYNNFDYDNYLEHYMCNETCKSCDNGICRSCKDGLYGGDVLVNGEQAFKCDKTCPEHCNHGFCDDHTGFCSHGCEHGHYGNRCDGICLKKCVFGECNSFGNCTFGCEGGYMGSDCTCALPCLECNRGVCVRCPDGTFGSTCAEYCPRNCKDELCDVINGSCSKGCADNFYGSHCNMTCPDTCNKVIGRVCDLIDGSCSNGCADNYYGPYCNITCPDTCNKAIGRVCDVIDGSCSKGCVDNVYGRYCNMTCPDTCRKAAAGRVCDVINGLCSTGCDKNFYGPHCSMTCPDTCSKIVNVPSCHSISGACLTDCLNGFYGLRCSDVCQHCVNNTCKKDSGVCAHGCIEGYSFNVDALKCLYGGDERRTSQFAGRIAKPFHVLIVVGIIAGAVVVAVVVATVTVVYRKRRRDASKRSELFTAIPMQAVSNSTYDTCEEPSTNIYDIVNGSDAVDIGRVIHPMYQSNGTRLQNSVRKERKKTTYKRTQGWRGKCDHDGSHLETLSSNHPSYISPIADESCAIDGYEVPLPSTSGRHAMDEHEANIYSEPDECFSRISNDDI